MHNPTLVAVSVIITVCVGLLPLGGCASRPGETEACYTLVYLKSGPTSGQGTPDERKAMFAGHMSNMARMADEGDLLIAGPFDNPSDQSWRGIYVFDVPEVSRAQSLSATDPGVKAGEFVPEIHVFRASASLRRVRELERERRAATKDAPADPSKPPANIRAYVMVTAENAGTARRALEATGLSKSIPWSGRFEGTRKNAGVFVIDATSADDVRKTLSTASPGLCAVDAWWSTASIATLRESR